MEDGFTIKAARCTQASGAGILVLNASPIIRQCEITGCIADFSPAAG